MKKIVVIAACIAAVFMLVACVPTEQTEVLIAPEAQNGPVEYDFIRLHNDTLSLFDGYEMYGFADSLDISGNEEEKMIYIEAVVPAEVDATVVDVFAAAVLRRINDAAMYQNYNMTESTALNMGDFWKEYGCKFSIYTADENGEKGDLIKEITFGAGEDIGLSPDTETYEAEYLRQLEILERNSR